MSIFKSASVGFVIAPGFRAADVVELQTIFQVFPRNRVHYVAATTDCIYGKSDFPIVPDTTFADCPRLDVLVVGEHLDAGVYDPAFLGFVRSKAAEARFVIGVSNGVVALGRAGVLKGLKATSDEANTALLEEFGVVPVHQKRVVVDGKFFTSGPSTGGIESAFMVMRALRGDLVTSLLELNLEYSPTEQFAPSGEEGGVLKELPADLEPLKVAVVTAPGMYAPDIMGAVDVLGTIPGTDVFYVWKEQCELSTFAGPTLVPSMTFGACPQVDVMVVGALLPGYTDEGALTDFLRDQEPAASAIICTCAGVLIVGSAGLLQGKRVATNFHMRGLLPPLGATASKEEVEVDGKIYSAGPAIGSYEAALRLVADLRGDPIAQYIEQRVLEYAPNPVFGTGSPERAGVVRTLISRALSFPLNAIYKRKAMRGYRRNIA